MDLSKFSTEDLQALKAGDLSKVSVAGLQELKSQRGAASSEAPTEAEGGLKDRALGAADTLLSYASTTAVPYRTLKAFNEDPATSQAALEGFGNGASLGYLPQLQAAAEAPMTWAMDKLTGQNLYDELPDYTARRDENIARQERQKEESPWASRIGGGLGALTTGIATAGMIPATGAGFIGPLTRTSAFANRLMDGLKAGALYGTLANPGDTQGKLQPVQPVDRLAHGAIGAGLGASGAAVGEGIALGAPVVAKGLRDAADWAAVRAAGPFKAQINKLVRKYGGSQAVKDLGREALDSGLVPWFGGRGEMLDRTAAVENKVGQQIGGFIDNADEAFSQMPPVGYLPADRAQTIGQEVRATPIKYKISRDGKAQEVLPEISMQPVTTQLNYGAPKLVNVVPDSHVGIPGIDTEVSTISSKIVKDGPLEILQPQVMMQPVKSSVSKAGPEEVIREAIQVTPIRPLAPGRVDAEQVANQVKNTALMKHLELTPGMEGAQGEAATYLDTLAKNGRDMTNRSAMELRGRIDSSINHKLKRNEMSPADQVLYEIRDRLRGRNNDNVNKYIEHVGGRAADQLKTTNARFSRLATLKDMLQGRHSAELANQSVGLGDKIVGAGGAAVGAKIGSMGGTEGAKIGAGLGAGFGVALNKMARQYGNQLRANSLDSASKLIAKSPWIGELIAANPQLAPILLQEAENKSTWDGAQ